MRFATAVSGPVASIKYTRSVSGYEDATKSVTSVYRGLLSGEEVVYYNSDTQMEA